MKAFLFFSQWLRPTKHFYPVYNGMILGICSCIDKHQYLVFFQPALAISDGQWVQCRFLVLPHWSPVWHKELSVSFYLLSVFHIRPKYNHLAKPLNWAGKKQTNTTYLVLKQKQIISSPATPVHMHYVQVCLRGSGDGGVRWGKTPLILKQPAEKWSPD